MTTVIKAGDARDLIAYAWFTIGFRPRESLVVIGLHGPRQQTGLVGRIDLPEPRAAAAVARTFAELLERNGDDACLLLIVSDTAGTPLLPPDGAGMAHDDLVNALGPALERAGAHVFDAVLVGEDAYRTYLCGDLVCCPAAGLPLASVDASPVAAAMVVAGRRVRDRESDIVADVEQAGPGREPELVLPRGRPGRTRRRVAFETWCADLDGRAVELARPHELLAGLRCDLNLRDAVLYSLTPDGRPAAHALLAGRRLDERSFPFHDVPPDPEVVDAGTRLLAGLARRAPAGLRVEPLAVLAWLAWWSGDGVRGRLLAERALADRPDHRLAGLVAALLAGMVPPPWALAGQPAAVPDLANGGLWNAHVLR